MNTQKTWALHTQAMVLHYHLKVAATVQRKKVQLQLNHQQIL
jgi:hypothetical protein